MSLITGIDLQLVLPNSLRTVIQTLQGERGLTQANVKRMFIPRMRIK